METKVIPSITGLIPGLLNSEGEPVQKKGEGSGEKKAERD